MGMACSLVTFLRCRLISRSLPRLAASLCLRHLRLKQGLLLFQRRSAQGPLLGDREAVREGMVRHVCCRRPTR